MTTQRQRPSARPTPVRARPAPALQPPDRTTPAAHATPVRARPAPALQPPDRTKAGAYNPSVQRRPSNAVKRTWVNALTNSTRNTLLTPTPGRRIRMARIWAVITPPEINSITLELYFGTGANATTDRSKLIDMLRTGTSAGVIQSRTYDSLSVGRAPTSAINEVISYRWGSTPAIDHDHRLIIEYIEEINTRSR